MQLIPFISQLAIDEQQMWCEALNSRLTQAQVVLPRNMSQQQMSTSSCAIVANPSVSDLAPFTSLVWVQSLWAGVDSLVNQLENPVFKVVRLVDPMLANIMAEAVLTWCLYLHRQIPLYQEQQRQTIWRQHEVKQIEQHNVDIIGLGELGQTSARLLRKVGFNVVGWSRTPKQIEGIPCYLGDDGLNQVLQLSDTVVVLLPLTKATQQMFDQVVFSQMKKGSAIINFARGGILNTPDLLKALDEAHLSHAVLDVFEQEPLPAESVIWHHPKITVTPHVSAPTNLSSASDIVARNIQQYVNTGEVPQAVNLNKGY